MREWRNLELGSADHFAGALFALIQMAITILDHLYNRKIQGEPWIYRPCYKPSFSSSHLSQPDSSLLLSAQNSTRRLSYNCIL